MGSASRRERRNRLAHRRSHVPRRGADHRVAEPGRTGGLPDAVDDQVSDGDGDLLVMTGDTQKHWHHRVPKARSRRPRVNINFRYTIEESPDACQGQ